MNDIITALNSIYYSTINNIDINLSRKEIVFDLTLTDAGNVTNHELRFIDCSSFLWIEKKIGETTYDYKNWDYYELTDINLCRVNATSEDKWLQQYPIEYNVVVEIWETALLIKADKLIVDNQHFLIP